MVGGETAEMPDTYESNKFDIAGFSVGIVDQKKILQEKNEVVQNSEAPSLEQNEEILKISREDALKEGERINFENENIKGNSAVYLSEAIQKLT